jgi:hypothetical protein
MIQRIQTIFMAIVALAMFSMLFLPVWAKQADGQTVVLDAMGLLHTQDGQVVSQTNTMYIGALALAIAAISIGSILSYKSRPKQLKMNLLNALLMFGLAAVNAYWVFSGGRHLFAPEMQGHFGLGFYMPMVGLVMNSLANRFILKDERLVKSVDRLR